MFQKETRKKLIKQNWLEIKQGDSNAYQTLKRFRDQSKDAIDDLSLVANKLPDNTLDEIFTSKKLEPFVLNILGVGPSRGKIKSSRNSTKRRTRIAAMLVEKCIDFCITQYDSLLSESPVLTGPTIRQLRESAAICTDIARKLELDDLRNQEKDENLSYLLNWDSISESDSKRLTQYLVDETNWPYDLLEIKKSPDNKTLSCLFGLVDFDGNIIVEIKIAHDEESAEVIFTNIHDIDPLVFPKKSKLIIRKVLDHRYLYKKGD